MLKTEMFECFPNNLFTETLTFYHIPLSSLGMKLLQLKFHFYGQLQHFN